MAVTEEISPLQRKIIRQVEYYFGDFNLPKDKFLKECVKENEGWITMETLLKFKRLSDLSKDAKEIMAALQKSDSGLMELDSDGDGKVRRNPGQPIPENNEEHKKILEARTAYAKGYDKENTTMDELLEFYAENLPKIVNIQMRNYLDKKSKTKHFKGSVFLTFRDEESCKAFVEAESIKYKEEELIRKYQKDYLEEKNKEYEEKKKQRGEKKGNKEESKEEEQKDEIKLPKGAVINITGLGGEITREDIKDTLNKEFEVNIDKDSGDIAFVNYQKGEAEAKIRFKVENYGKSLMEKINKAEKVVIKEMEVKITLLEGEEEDQFLADSARELKNHRFKNKNHKRRNQDRDGGHGKRFKRN